MANKTPRESWHIALKIDALMAGAHQLANDEDSFNALLEHLKVLGEQYRNQLRNENEART